jgi:hypothetical protein
MAMQDGATISVAEAATRLKADKTTVIRAVKASKIDGAFKNEFGDWRIPPSGLKRYRRRNPRPMQIGTKGKKSQDRRRTG